MESRLDALECKLMAAEDLLDGLNMTLFRQQEAIALLQSQVLDLKRQLHSAQPGGAGRPEDEVPPHY
ncbi:MAG TPA: SlyX family protein [Denitromonas sp.]|uniref:SlyX family protein n=1 Tax=Denitromonas sp. TaxID=2734609 RepID=UPI001D41BD21|nr:SlyX family protein [Rhodocyclaceae bacterium]MCP5220577.1 SlyX family protein [Zoogloeaceae bacterium]HPR05027.1 SlyX family protein [Denitromonas sp.]HQU88210.1 SlyX family protein [Denitromonas sp.]HQV14342.1 SlyX family protein [Denitromonas sp.]